MAKPLGARAPGSQNDGRSESTRPRLCGSQGPDATQGRPDRSSARKRPQLPEEGSLVMAHEVYGSRFVAARNAPAWHGMMTRLPEDRDYTVEEALDIGDITFPYVTVPVGYTTPAGDFVESGSRNVILRGPSR